MPVVLRVEPNQPPLRWDEFVTARPPFAIAIDGYVAAGPRFDPTGPRLNLNHHEDVDRLATRATCAQALLAIRQGLFDRFRDDHGPCAIVYCNDCDEDVCTAWYLLEHAFLAEHTINPLLNRLVALEDLLDATAGAYPFPPDLPMLGQLAWVFEPYRQFRLHGGLDHRRTTEAFTDVITNVVGRIERHLAGQAQAIPLDTRYETLQQGNGWSLVREIGAHARTRMFADNIHAFIAVRDHSPGRWSYVVGRMSVFVPFDVPVLLAALNEAEGLTGPNRWGGSNTVGGSPRVGGSQLSPVEVVQVVNSALAWASEGGNGRRRRRRPPG